MNLKAATLLLATFFTVTAPKASGAESDGSVLFEIQPKACVLPELNATCIVELLIKIKQGMEETSCLYLNGIKVTECSRFDKNTEISKQLGFSATATLELRTIDGKLIATQIFQVMAHEAKTRRRRGIGWSIL